MTALLEQYVDENIQYRMNGEQPPAQQLFDELIEEVMRRLKDTGIVTVVVQRVTEDDEEYEVEIEDVQDEVNEAEENAFVIIRQVFHDVVEGKHVRR